MIKKTLILIALICVINNSFAQTYYEHGEFEDPRDGTVYRTIKLGSNIWLADNLAYKPNTGSYWYVGGDESNTDEYGLLYNWETAQNVCPVGWHLPDKEDMEDFAGTDRESLKDAYEMLKMGGQYEFFSNYPGEVRVINGRADYLANNLTSDRVGKVSLWTTTEYDKKRAYTFNLINLRGANISAVSSYKKNGYSVRCVKDK